MSGRKSKVTSLSIAKGVLMISNVASGAVFARTLTTEDYGTYLQTFLAYNFVVPILTLGLPSALYYFLPGAIKDQKGLVLDNLFLLFLGGLIFSLFLVFGGTDLLATRFNNPDLAKNMEWMIGYPLYTFPIMVASAVWVTVDKVKLNSIYNIIKGLILTIGLIVTAWITKSYEAPTLIRIFIPLLFFPLTIYLIFKYVPGGWRLPSIKSMWEMAKFSIPLGLASVLGTLTVQLANIIVSILTAPEVYAIYAVGAREVPLVGIITGSISVIVMADMAKKIKEGELNGALKLFRKSAVMSSLFLLPVMFFLMLYAESFIEILYSSNYEESVLPFRIYLFMLPVRLVYYGAAFVALGKTKAILFRSFIELALTALLAYFFTLWMSYIGAAIATVLMYYIFAIPYNVTFLGKHFHCKPISILPLKRIGFIALISLSAIPTALMPLILIDNRLLSFVIGGITFTLTYYSVSSRYIPEMKEITQSFINKLPWIK